MPAAMPGEEGDAASFELASDVGVRGRAKRRVQADFFLSREFLHRVEAAAANDAYFRLGCAQVRFLHKES